MKNLMLLLTLMLSCFHSYAMIIKGDIHPERYTFLLNNQGGEVLGNINDINLKLRTKPGNIPLLKELEDNVNKIGINSNEDPIWKKGNIRWDGKPPVALTCLIATTRNPVGNFYQDITYCADETGAEYIGLKGWPLQQALEKTCKVGQSDCPVYLVLQGDDPTLRNDSVQFQPAPVGFNANKQDINKLEEVKLHGCNLANEIIQQDKCIKINNVKSNGEYENIASFTTQSGNVYSLVIKEENTNQPSRTVSIRSSNGIGGFYSQLLKNGEWKCVGPYGKCQ
ncbi:hypothetical protein PSR30_13585 [Pectobacterium carotovorum subsp. carotovorum]|uniref:hypothetical protein n=1 Tax=Pectobacterium carotovorum TaxID=554 RepID=UPI00193853D7|nr:hypothetical protein [Pectobacterium carotovorum]QQK71703.1 hypothetical protein HG702_09435 [Pectobacterium versatile]WDF97457.1 hypothetical protein PSR30_13585 [Pectobacterium carotovorum subsp. carotovorum]